MRESGSEMMNLSARRAAEGDFGWWVIKTIFWVGIGFWIGQHHK